MKIIYIVPSSGGVFYCQNCIRDISIIKALKKEGHDIISVPMYLPSEVKEESGKGPPVFFGAVGTYLREQSSFFRMLPTFVQRIVDATPFLTFAAKKASSVRAHGLEEMTISMLKGENGNHQEELKRLVSWLKTETNPDIIHISNALLSGLVPPLKQEFGCPVVCSLQDEINWIEAMEEESADEVWALMTELSADIDYYLPVSRYYGDAVRKKMNLPGNKMHLVYPGLDFDGYPDNTAQPEKQAIGYLSRMCCSCGLGILFEAFLKLKEKKEFADLTLHVTGGQTGDDIPFLEELKKRIASENISEYVFFHKTFEKEDRIKFLSSLSVLSVPNLKGEAFGLYLLEAMASGVPVVQPDIGAFPEIIEITHGGQLYHPNTPAALAEALSALLSNPQAAQAMAEKGRKAVLDEFSSERFAKRLMNFYGNLIG